MGADIQEGNKDTRQGEQDAQQAERTFTQEEVNRIVQERLARIKSEPNEKETELEQRSKDLEIRERKLKAKTIFSENRLPKELLDILDYSDDEKMNQNIEILEKAYSTGGSRYNYYTPAAGAMPMPMDPVREAMGLK